MSVVYTSGIAYGYKVTREQLTEAATLYNEEFGLVELVDILYEEDMIIPLNSWTESCDYIVGVTLCTCEEDMAIALEKIKPVHVEKNQVMKVYNQYLSHLNLPNPQLYLFQMVS